MAAQEMGVPISMGTDAGMFGHADNAFELECMVDVGLTPMQSIVATTKTAAQCVGLGDQIGTIEAGKLADLLAVDGDPLQDITVFRQKDRLRLVMKDGAIYKDRLPNAAERAELANL